MIGALGAEIDRLEAEIRQLVPGIRHIDLVRCRWHVTFRAYVQYLLAEFASLRCLNADPIMQETDRGRHDKGPHGKIGLYTVEADAP